MSFSAYASDSYSYIDLIGTLTNLEHLAELPSAGEKSAEWTSRDRASTYDATSQQYLNWNANNDGTGNLGTQTDGGIIMAQMNGPGCIWRMWSAQVGTGRVKIFLDGSNAPAVDLAFQDYFNRTHFPFNYPSLTYSVCGGFDSYLPIPYNQSCKVVAYGSWGQYFHFNYSTFAPGTIVPTFTTNLTVAEQTALSNVNDFFVNHLGADPAGARNGEITVTNSYAIPPGTTVTNLNLNAQGAITTFKVRVQNVSGTNASWRALRELTVSMYWDGEAMPSVWAPLGDFFGSGCGYLPYQALPLGMETSGWMYSHWYMPFASGAKIVLGNDGSVARNVDVIVTYAPLTKSIAGLTRFHAKWNRGSYVTSNGRSPDYRFLNVSGEGRFVGLAMHIYQKVDFSPGPWWGEGDEKFFVDGETMPSWFGTGSEDYFGFAWGTPGYFSQPYHSQLLAPPGNLFAPGNRALNRFHITDNVPFQSGFDGCIEKWQYTNENATTYGVMPYWYQASDGNDSYTPLPLNVRTTYYVPNGPQSSSGANVMNYGADGNDYFRFTTPSMAFDKASGFTTLIAFAMHVDADGTLEIGGGPVCSNGVYIGPGNWGALVNTLKTPPTTVTRYEVSIGGWLDTSYDNIKSLVQSQGTGPGSILYRNFQALKNAVPGIDAINDDDEKTYDLNSTTGLANMLGGLGYEFTTVPYTFQSFWVNLNNSITNCDYIYLQCYAGGAGNDPVQWNAAFGHGVKVVPGQESNTASPATFRNWYLQTGTQGGFYYPDVVFSSTYWSAAIIEADGSLPAAPAGLATSVAGGKVKLSWNVVPGAISYNVKRATASGAETTVANISTANNPWPISNQFIDSAPANSVTNYYKVSALNTNGESLNSVEASVSAPVPVAWFKADAINTANGAGVAVWPDSSGFGFTAIQTMLSQRPTFVTGALNGLPVVHFESTNSQVITFNRPVQDDFTLFCVFRSSQGLTTDDQFSDGAGLISATVAGVTNDFGACLFANGQICAGIGNPDTSVKSLAGYNDGHPHLMTLRRTKSSGVLELFVDGNFSGSVTGNTNSLKAPVKLALGAQLTLNNFFTGDIAEVKIYNGALSDSDRLTQEANLFQKWGVSGVSAGLLAYEGFNYPAGDTLSGQFGGLGWSNVWMDVSGTASAALNAGNLLVASQAPNGFDNRSSGNSAFVGNNSRSGRWLDCSPNGTFAEAGYLNASGNIGAPGKTLYLSFLQQPSSPVQFYEFEFHRGNLGDPGRIAGIGNDLANAATVNLRAPNSVQTPFALGDTNVNFYVLRIDYHGGSDDVYVYRNPTRPDESDNEPALTMLGVADMSFNGLSMAAYLNGVTVNHDEIRLGTTWASVLGDPLAFVVQPTNQLAYVGQTVAITSLAQSSQPLDYQWYRGNNLLAGQTNATLTLSNVQLAHAGQYSAVASNALASATSAAATLTVQTVSVAISGAASVPVGPGSNVLISATVGGASPLILQWYKNGETVPGATAATLALGGNGFFDAGKYSLVASNIYGTVTSSVVNVFSNSGGLLAYDGFNYGQSSSDIAGANGGFGWAGAWANLDGPPSQSLSNSLVGGTNAPFGYDAHSLDGYLAIANSSRKGRFFDCSPTGAFAERGYIDSSGNIGADGTTLYLSFLQQPSSTSPFYEFELKRGDLGDGGRIGGIGNDLGSGNNDANLRIQSPAGANSTFYDLGPGSTGVNFYVLRIDYHAGNDTVTVYRNPTSATEPINATLRAPNVADMSLSGISFGSYLNGVTVSHDEVRVGATWADVVGKTISALQVTQGTNHALSVSLAGSPNYSYQLQASTNVTGPWTNAGSVALPGLGVSQWAETNAVNDHRFYRALNGLTASGPRPADSLIADFEQLNYGAWVTTGTAFGSGPAPGTLPNQQTVSGYAGSGLVNSFLGGDGSTGTLTSPPFIITKPYLDFLIGGGNISGQECMNLIVSNVIVATATGTNSETLASMQWDVSAYLGQTATLQLVDSATGGWGHILIDQITLSDTAFPALSRTLLLTNNLLNLPVKNGAPMKRVTITAGGKAVRDFNIQLANGIPDWWAFVDVSAFSNQMATVSVNSLPPGSTGLSSVVQSNGIVGATNLYAETLRPQLHFSSKRGWLNDANGMFFDNGQYHLYYQHDPFNWDGSGQKWWGHVVSVDMVNWQELPEGIYSHAYGDDVWSGSAVVDTANTSGLQTGTNRVIAAAFYSTARGECMAFSADGGMTFVDYANNPVVVHSGTGRDPHLFWYAPSNYWCMAVYDDAGGNGIQFYSSPDLQHWSFRSKIYNGFFECPDMFQLPVDGNAGNRMWVLCDASGSYQLGQFNGATFTPASSKLPCQSGSGFYASQTFTSMKPGDNRVVRMAWAQISTPGMPFNQLMYFPTALTLLTTSNGVRLCSTPVAEITNNAANTYSWTNLTLNPGYNPLSGIRGTLFDLKAQFSAGTAQSVVFTFQGITVTYNAGSQQISCNGDTRSLPAINGSVQLEIVVDRNTIEIFGNNGQLYMPLPANNSNSLVSLTCTGGSASFSSLTVNKLKSIWTGLSN